MKGYEKWYGLVTIEDLYLIFDSYGDFTVCDADHQTAISYVNLNYHPQGAGK